MRKFTDIELLDLLEANNKEPSYSNLCILKEGLANGTILLEEDMPEEIPAESPVEGEELPVDGEMPVETQEQIPDENVDEIPSEGEVPQEDPSASVEELPPAEGNIPPENQPTPGISISLPVDGSMAIQANNKTINTDPQGNLNVQITERFLHSNNINIVLESFLLDECKMTLKEFVNLNEEEKIQSVKEIAVELLNSIQEKLSSIDTSIADKTRGDIKQLKNLDSLQDSITQIETVLERDENTKPEYKEMLSNIIKAILYINQYSNTFKDAYRNKKTLMIMKYESLILSVISCVSYMLATILDYSNDEVKVKVTTKELLDFAPYRTLKNFVESVDSGEFKTIIRDVTVMREFFLEVPVEKMEVVLEAAEYGDMIVDGIKNLADAVMSGDSSKILNLLYKAAGIIMLLLSIRDVLYTLFRMRYKVSDMLGSITNFANLNNGGGILGKLSSFSNKFSTDAESSSEIAQREIEDENKGILKDVREIQYNKPSVSTINNDPIEIGKPSGSSANQSAEDIFGFDF